MRFPSTKVLLTLIGQVIFWRMSRGAEPQLPLPFKKRGGRRKGAGRERKDDKIDHAVGLFVHKKVGDGITQGETTFTLYANDPTRLEQAKKRLTHAIVYSNRPTAPLPTFYDTITT